ncbi:MAG: hypothetical protein FJX53_08225 [Alphaproteobacteria bacterium]|nr:hypothetical protein [Alphaproteobacteria bacterium]
MILEHRAYTLLPGNTAAFWQSQIDRGFAIAKPIMERVLGYFVTVGGPAEQIVHIYRFDDLPDWQTRLRGMYTVKALEPYFKIVRPLMAAQENSFWLPAPVAAATPLWNDRTDWMPGDKPVADLARYPRLVVEEEVLTMKPGKLLVFWPLLQQHGLAALAGLDETLIGCFFSMSGAQHRVVWYRWFPDVETLRARRETAAGGRAWGRYHKVLRDIYAAHETNILEPAPVPEMIPLFVEAAVKGRAAPVGGRKKASRRG